MMGILVGQQFLPVIISANIDYLFTVYQAQCRANWMDTVLAFREPAALKEGQTSV